MNISDRCRTVLRNRLDFSFIYEIKSQFTNDYRMLKICTYLKNFDIIILTS